MSSAEGIGQFVITFPSVRLAELGAFQGLSFDVARYLPAILTADNCRWSPRPEAEVDTSRKHLLSYVLLAHDGTIFKYRRGTPGSALAARNITSIGIDVHVALTEAHDALPDYAAQLDRQLRSEIQLDAPFTNRVAALINDDDDRLGKYHFGVVHVVRLERPVVSAGSKAMSEEEFVPIGTLREAGLPLERWSQFCLEQIERLI